MMQNQTKLRILQIMSGYGGGIASFIKNKAEQMPQYGIVFDVVTYDECPEDFVAAIQTTVGNIYRLKNPKTEGWLAFKQSFTSVLEQHQYDVIYCNINGYRALPYALLSRRYNMPKFYIHAHNSADESKLSLIDKSILHHNQRLNRCLSDAVLGCGVKANRGIFGENTAQTEMMIIPNSINAAQFLKSAAETWRLRQIKRAEFGLLETEMIIGHIGRLKSVKNHALTLKLAQYMKNNQLPGKILIIGSGELEEQLKSQVASQQLEKQVKFTGRINPISEIYPALDVVMLPSFSEGLPTVMIEAQAANVPVAVSDVVTNEADLDLGLVKAVSLKDDMAQWYSALVQLAEQTPVALEKRQAAVTNMKFSNEASAKLFADFLLGRISHHRIKK